jgi:hypothetical protein
MKGRKPGLFVTFGQPLCSWIRILIRIPNTDPDPGQQNECRSFWIRIHKTVFHLGAHLCKELNRGTSHIRRSFSLPRPSFSLRLNVSLFQAVKTGNILVIDEADKAPTNVTCILKSLAENGEMILSGRRHCACANRFYYWLK